MSKKIQYRNIELTAKEASYVRTKLTVSPSEESECFGETETFSKTAVFDDGVEMDIKMCGVKYREGESNLPWVEAVLFRNGSELYCSDPDDDMFGEWELEYGGVKYCVMVKEASSYNSNSYFEDDGICDYSDSIERAIREIYELHTGGELQVENECQTFDDIREELATRFNGCYPAWVSDNDEDEEVACFRLECVYECAHCPMIKGNAFKYYEPNENATVEERAAELIRCIKCNSNYRPDEEEVDWVITTIADTCNS